LLAKALLETLVAPEMLATQHRVLEMRDEVGARVLAVDLLVSPSISRVVTL
jgi:hypothetical protein